MLTLQTFTELFALGFNPIPVIWDTTTKQVTNYPKHETDITDGRPQLVDVKRWLDNGFKNFNGIALKLYAPYGMFDFDLKNTDNKSVYHEWIKTVQASIPDVLSKILIETTRNNGYHVYIKYDKLDGKIPVARNAQGEEVISVYTGGLLSFCYPSPGYSIIHGDFEQVDFLTDDEFEIMVACAAYFNESPVLKSGQSKVSVTDYPTEYESVCLQFDYKCTDDVFETLLNSIDLYRVSDSKRRWANKAYVPFLRSGSVAEYSAKAYFSYNIEHEGMTVAKSKRLLIFSASMYQYPTWHDSAKSGDNTWSLSPSKIIFYKNDKDWTATIEEIKCICESACIDIIEQVPITQQPIIHPDRLKFPYDIFPTWVQNFISFQAIQHEYLAGGLLVSLSTALGNTVYLEAMSGYIVKPIMYMAVIAPPGASKTPALKKSFAPLEEYDSALFEKYAASMQHYKLKLSEYKRDKKGEEPVPPPFPQTLIKDSTIEMVIKILSDNKIGCCVFADELSGFLNRMNQYKTGDEVQKWLELWSGSPVLMQRITREANKVEQPFCNVVGGIQPGVLEQLSKAENEHNGFFHRFLFIYPKPKDKSNWERVTIPEAVSHEFYMNFSILLQIRSEHVYKYTLSDEADALYKQWFDNKNIKYNKSPNDHVRGIIAKYQDYCLRFAILIQAVHDLNVRFGKVEYINMERAIRLTEYFLGNMHKATKILIPETPVDKLTEQYRDLYNSLPQAFSTKVAIECGEQFNIKETTIKTFLNRQTNKLFLQIERGKYEKMY